MNGLAYIVQDILTVKGGVIFHQVNTLGVMGAGLALQLRKKWPVVFDEYKEFCNSGKQALGAWLVTKVSPALRVCHLFAQDEVGTHKRMTNYTALARALAGAALGTALHGPRFFPWQMGCGLAGGDWKFVQLLIEENFPDAIICKLKP